MSPTFLHRVEAYRLQKPQQMLNLYTCINHHCKEESAREREGVDSVRLYKRYKYIRMGFHPNRVGFVGRMSKTARLCGVEELAVSLGSKRLCAFGTRSYNRTAKMEPHASKGTKRPLRSWSEVVSRACIWVTSTSRNILC